MKLEYFSDFTNWVESDSGERFLLEDWDIYEYYGRNKDALLIVGTLESIGDVFLAVDVSMGKQDLYNILTYTIGNKRKTMDAYNGYKERHGWMMENKKGVKRMKKLTERINEADRINALKQFLIEDEGVDAEDLTIESSYRDEEFETSEGDYLVLTEDEADDMAQEYTVEILRDTGIEGVNLNLEDFVDEDWFRMALEESNEFYVQDIASESSRNYENRLVEECYDAGLIDDDNFETDEDGDPDYESCTMDEYELQELYTDYLNDMIKDPIQEFISEFGTEEFNRTVIEKDLVDLDAMAEEIIKWDGRGPTLAGYDGTENEVKYDGEWFYIYRTN